MDKCLTFSPKRRIDVEEALKHPYLEVSVNRDWFEVVVIHIVCKAYHDPMDEPTADPLDPSFFDFDYGPPLAKDQLKGELIR